MPGARAIAMSDDVTQFLQQVQQLQGSRADAGDASSRELEEKILQEKSERAARRAGTSRPPGPLAGALAGARRAHLIPPVPRCLGHAPP